MRKITLKVPKQVADYITTQADKSGMGVQQLAGQILVHGLNDLMKRQAEQQRSEDVSSDDQS